MDDTFKAGDFLLQQVSDARGTGGHPVGGANPACNLLPLESPFQFTMLDHPCCEFDPALPFPSGFNALREDGVSVGIS